MTGRFGDESLLFRNLRPRNSESERVPFITCARMPKIVVHSSSTNQSGTNHSRIPHNGDLLDKEFLSD